MVRIFSYFIFNPAKREGDSWNSYQKLYIKINRFSNNFQAGMFISEHEGWIKMNENY